MYFVNSGFFLFSKNIYFGKIIKKKKTSILSSNFIVGEYGTKNVVTI